ncbi:MAG: DUF933 domain-containing protein [Actinomycetota bacterium]
MKSVGITGPPRSGKTSLLRALAAGEPKAGVAAVPVPDPRLGALARIQSGWAGSPKMVPVRLEISDVHASAPTPAAALARLREVDALLIVVPAFSGAEPGPALQAILDDLMLADMVPIETRLASARKDPGARGEIPVLEAALAHLAEGRLLAQGAWEEGDLRVLSPLAPITLKPLVVIWNVDESGLVNRPAQIEPHLATSASLEAEVAELEDEDAAALLEAFGIAEPVRARATGALYRCLDLITFFTVNEREAHAWELRRGATALEAAGAVHTDMQRGFIRAEVIGFEELARAGSWTPARSAGLGRVEGKSYVIADGDVIYFRFAL